MSRRWMGLALLACCLGGAARGEDADVVPSHLTVEADYLAWWLSGHPIPALVTRGDFDDLVPGAVGQPGTSPLIGPSDVTTGLTSGVRVSALWKRPCGDWALGASAFAMEEDTVTRSAGGNGLDPNLTLSRPFFDPNFNQENADPLVVPGVQGGTFEVRFPRRFQGADAAVRFNQAAGYLPFDHCVPLLGFRFLNLEEAVEISQTVSDLPGLTGPLGNTTTLRESFEAKNRFYGGQVGVEVEKYLGAFTFKASGKLALGTTSQEVRISGDTTVVGPLVGVANDSTRGLLVQPTNRGSFSRNTFAAVPEVGLKVVWDATEYVQLNLGYSLIFWSGVARPGDQIDTTINLGALAAPEQFGEIRRPAFPFDDGTFWAQGIDVGLRFSF